MERHEHSGPQPVGVILPPSHWECVFFFLFSSEPTSEGTAVFTVLYSESRRVTWQTLREQQVSALIKIYKKKRKVIKKSHKNTQMKKTCCATEVFCRSAGAELRPGSFLLFSEESNVNQKVKAKWLKWSVLCIWEPVASLFQSPVARHLNIPSLHV